MSLDYPGCSGASFCGKTPLLAGGPVGIKACRSVFADAADLPSKSGGFQLPKIETVSGHICVETYV